MEHISLDDVVGGYNLAAINSNFQRIEDHLNDNVLNRTNPANLPNSMSTDIDMNGRRIYNLPAPIYPNEPARLADVQSGGGGGGSPTNLSTTVNAENVIVNSDTGTDATIPAATSSLAGVMLPAQVNKLTGVANGATANSTDAQLRDRSTHTGTQSSSTINDFSEAVDDRVANLLVAGTNISLTYNDAANSLTINSTGSGGGGSGANLSTTLSPTNVIVNSDTGTDATIPAADGTNAGVMLPAQVTKLAGVATGATANDTDTNLKNRANHTGTQLASTISNFADNVRSAVLTGVSFAVSTAITASDTVLTALGKLQAQISLRAPINTPSFTGVSTFQGVKETVVTANTGTAYSINIGSGTIQNLTLTGNCVFTFPTATIGEQFTLFLSQDSTGSRTVTWPASVRWAGGTAPSLTTTASKTDVLSFIFNGTYWVGFVGGLNYTL